MGSVSAKPLAQTLAPPSEPATPPTTSSPKAVSCPPKTHNVSHSEWDECIRQSTLTIGTTTAAAIAVGLMVPAANTVLLLGTGAGVLWSVKRCRTIMRDGILSPEQAKALEHKKMMDREERRRQRKMEKEARQRAAKERKLLAKQKKEELGNKTGNNNSKECCTKVKKALEQKGLKVDDLPCEQLSHENGGPKSKVGNTFAIETQSAGGLISKEDTLQDLTALVGSISKVSYTEGRGESTKFLKAKPGTVNPSQPKSSGDEEPANTVAKTSGTYSTVKLFAPYARFLSESVVLTCDSKECTCNSSKDDCTCDPEEKLNDPQPYILATDAENEDLPEQEEDPENLIVQEVKTVITGELGNHSEVQISAESTSAGNGVCSNNDALDQPMKVEAQKIVQELEEDEQKTEVMLSPPSDNMGPFHDDSSVEIILADKKDLDVEIEDAQGSLDFEVIKHEIGDEQIEQLKNEVEVAFSETYKSESWPFSFSLPSLDKFSKKKNNSFKWPPLTSSIIVKPKKEPTCKCSDGLGTPNESGNSHKKCTCGLSKNECTCH